MKNNYNSKHRDDIDTFTILHTGLYSLTCVLSLNNINPAVNTFYIRRAL